MGLEVKVELMVREEMVVREELEDKVELEVKVKGAQEAQVAAGEEEGEWEVEEVVVRGEAGQRELVRYFFVGCYRKSTAIASGGGLSVHFLDGTCE